MTDHTDLIERLYGRGSRPPCDEDRIEAADAIAALVKREAELERAVRMAFDDARIATASCEAENAALQARVKRLEDALRDIHDNYDCDEAAHRYNTRCRCCVAEAALAEGGKP